MPLVFWCLEFNTSLAHSLPWMTVTCLCPQGPTQVSCLPDQDGSLAAHIRGLTGEEPAVPMHDTICIVPFQQLSACDGSQHVQVGWLWEVNDPPTVPISELEWGKVSVSSLDKGEAEGVKQRGPSGVPWPPNQRAHCRDANGLDYLLFLWTYVNYI